MILRARGLSAAAVALALLTAGAQTRAAQGGAAPEQAGPYHTLVIRNVTVIDGSGAPAFGPVNITIQDSTIGRVDPVDPINAGRGVVGTADEADRVIDGTGMYVIPGLVDGHVHVSSNPAVPADYIYKLFLGPRRHDDPRVQHRPRRPEGDGRRAREGGGEPRS